MKKEKVYERIKGFTLVELLIVMAIIGILITIVVVAIDPTRLIQDSRDSKKRQEMQQLKNSLQLYFNDSNTPVYPADNSTLQGDLVSGYTRALPGSFSAPIEAIYQGPGNDGVPAGEYRAGVILDRPSTDGDDDGTYGKCGGNEVPSEIPDAVADPLWGEVDYFICPD